MCVFRWGGLEVQQGPDDDSALEATEQPHRSRRQRKREREEAEAEVCMVSMHLL